MVSLMTRNPFSDDGLVVVGGSERADEVVALFTCPEMTGWIGGIKHYEVGDLTWPNRLMPVGFAGSHVA